MLLMLICVGLTFSFSHSHVRLVCPRPLSPMSYIKFNNAEEDVKIHEKCLSTKISGKDDIMEIQPGFFTVRFEETTFMAGAPFRILLIKYPSGHEIATKSVKQSMKTKRDAGTLQTAMNETVNGSSQSVKDGTDSVLNEANVTSILQNVSSSLDVFLNDTTNQTDENETIASVEVKEGNSTDTLDDTHKVSLPNITSENVTKEDTVDRPGDKEDGQKRPSDDGESKLDALQSCLLLDHIPHNDHAVIKQDCQHKSNEYPLGTCTESTYYITLRIPDVSCTDCLLVVQQVDTDPDHTVCELTSEGESSDCATFISCARVTVRPTVEGQQRNLSHCANYLDNLPGNWPYRPQDLYVTEDKAMITMDLKHNDLHIEIPHESNSGRVEKVEIRINSMIVWNASVVTPGDQGGAKLIHVTWKQVPTKFSKALKANQMILNVIRSKQSKASEILYKEQHFKNGNMTALYDIFSPSGWLVAPKFMGPQAVDPVAAMPAGECAPVARHFLSFFESAESGNHGLLGMTVLENRAYITTVLHVHLGQILSIRLVGSDLVGAKSIDISVPAAFDGVLQTAIDITEQLPYMDTVQFFKSVEVKTDRDDAIMVGDLEEGFYSILSDEKGQIKGMGVFQLTQGYWMRVEIVSTESSYLNQEEVDGNEEELDLLSEKASVEVVTSYSQLLDLTKEAVYCHEQFCSMEAYVHELNSDILLHLLNGQATLRVLGDKSTISGQITGPSGCRPSGGFCQISKALSDDNAYTKVKGGVIQAIVLPDRSHVLELSMQVKNIAEEWMKKKYSAKIINEKGPPIKFPLSIFNISQNIYILKGKYPLSNMKYLLKEIYEPESTLKLKVTNGAHTLIDDKLPSMTARMCISSKIHVVGKGKNYWSSQSAPFKDLYAVVSDNIKFVFDNSTSLFLMNSKESFEKCDFSKATKLEILNKVREMGLHFFTLKKAGTFYFADKHSCKSSKPAKLVVNAIQANDNIVKDNSRGQWCHVSFYSAWRQNILDQWEGPMTSGSIVMGIALGMFVGVIFLLWQRIRMKQSSHHGGMGIGRRSSLTHFVRF